MTEEKLAGLLDKTEAKIAAEAARLGDRIPYIAQDGHYLADLRTENPAWWTNGFWAGILWQLYPVTHAQAYLEAARASEESFDALLSDFEQLHHDVGFMFLHTAVADWRITHNPRSRTRALHAATILAGRYNPQGQFIRAWNEDKAGWMIIDCLMNLSLLFWASEETGDPRFAEIAARHADTALRVLQRPDGSCHHIAVLDPLTGEVLDYPAGQGCAKGSSWSRGQAWAIYGFALACRHTGQLKYLDAAKRTAHYFIAQTACTGGIALADFRAPQTPVYRDTTATACAACGLLELSDLLSAAERDAYRAAGAGMLEALADGSCCFDLDRDGILQGGTVAYGRLSQTHVPIIYGDYFLTEGLLRLAGRDTFLW